LCHIRLFHSRCCASLLLRLTFNAHVSATPGQA